VVVEVISEELDGRDGGGSGDSGEVTREEDWMWCGRVGTEARKRIQGGF